MTDARLDGMVEDAAAQQWEEENTIPYEHELWDASVDLRLADKELDKVSEYVMDAIDILRNTPMQERLESALNALEDVQTDLKMLAMKYARGRID